MPWKMPALPTLRELPALPGFSFEESLSGSYWRLDAPTKERDIAFRVRASIDDMASFAKTRAWRLEGTMYVEGVAHQSDAEGIIALKLLDERRVLYRLAFRGDDGNAYELSGQKEWSGLSPVTSMTLLAGSLYDEHGEELARATLRFDLRSDTVRWVKSFRLHAPWLRRPEE
jgi:hypothetical protein